MRIKLLLLALIGVIAIAFSLEPDSGPASKRRGSAKLGESSESQNQANKSSEKSQSQLEPVVERYEIFPPLREKAVASKKNAEKNKQKNNSETKLAPTNMANQLSDNPAVNAWNERSWAAPLPKPKPIVTVAAPVQVFQQRSTLPIMPPLPFIFVGAMDTPQGGQIIFLREGDRQFNVQAGETIEQQWRIERLDKDRVIIKHLSTNTDTFVARGHTAD
jgi:hypothetical protein